MLTWYGEARLNLNMRERRNELATVTAILALALMLTVQPEGLHGETSSSPVAASRSEQGIRAVTSDAQMASINGIKWLVAQKDAMSLGFALKSFEKIHRATADVNVRSQMAALITNKLSELPTNAPSFDREIQDWYSLKPLVKDLIYLRSQGKPWKEGAARIARLFAERGESVLPSHGTLSERLVAAYQLRQLGVPAETLYTNTLAEIRAQVSGDRQFGGGSDMMRLYAGTHIIFTASGYYRRYLDPAQFAPEVAQFNKALKHIASSAERIEDNWGDLASEILIARKILRLPPDAQSQAVSRRLMAAQNADGSWGSGPLSNGKVHYTALAVLALMEFGSEFQVGFDYM